MYIFFSLDDHHTFAFTLPCPALPSPLKAEPKTKTGEQVVCLEMIPWSKNKGSGELNREGGKINTVMHY